MKKVLAAAAAVMALGMGAAAHAATFQDFDGSSGVFVHSNIVGSFDDIYNFDNVGSGTYDVSLTTSSKGLTFTTYTFNGETLDYTGPGQYRLDNVSVASGAQKVEIAGNYSGKKGSTGSYDGTVNFTVSAAPEPATWALMMAGIGGIGLALRVGRRNKTAALAA